MGSEMCIRDRVLSLRWRCPLPLPYPTPPTAPISSLFILFFSFYFFSSLERYIEASKTRIGSFASGDSEGADARANSARRTLVYVFDTCLRLLHPYMPFVTEALWQQLPREGEALIVAPWPKVGNKALPVDKAAISRCGGGVVVPGDEENRRRWHGEVWYTR